MFLEEMIEMKLDKRNSFFVLFIFGLVIVVWLSLLIAPYWNSSFIDMIEGISKALSHPFVIYYCEDSFKVIFIFLLI